MFALAFGGSAVRIVIASSAGTITSTLAVFSSVSATTWGGPQAQYFVTLSIHPRLSSPKLA